jgi:hypothetical protein
MRPKLDNLGQKNQLDLMKKVVTPPTYSPERERVAIESSSYHLYRASLPRFVRLESISHTGNIGYSS